MHYQFYYDQEMGVSAISLETTALMGVDRYRRREQFKNMVNVYESTKSKNCANFFSPSKF